MSRFTVLPALLTALLVLAAPLNAADDHAGHNHSGGDAHAHGKTEAIGSVDIGVYKVAVSASGAIAAGKEWHLELQLNPTQPAPKAIRVWVGTESGRESIRAKAEAEKDAKSEFSAHVLVPNPIPNDSKLWIAIEAENGNVIKRSLPIPTDAKQVPNEHKH
ncbi:MAG: hypothetical protein L6R48_23750 [Planctomycetes bacterium]|nr:hypothetical protein [Planctomycetota bacterium]